MNLIERTIKKSSVGEFKNYQFNMHEEMIINGLKYLINLGLSYDPNVYDINTKPFDIIGDILYDKLNHYAVKGIKVKLFEEKHYFMHINIPIVLASSFYQLNGVYYVPINYITDEPIIKKENSLFISSTFQPITLYFKQDRVIFMGHNIQLSDFLQLLTYDWDIELKKIVEYNLSIDIQSKDVQSITDIIADKLYIPPDVKQVKLKIEELFFDDWTKDLYSKFYNIEPTIDNVLKTALNKWIFQEQVSFIDLRYKRLTFIEPLLRPYFKAITLASSSLLKGIQPRSSSVKIDTIIKKGFFGDLDGNVLYDAVNGFSSILSHKATFKNPFGKGKLPKEVSSIHFTHKGRICTCSISNHDPGQVINLIPDQDIDFRYGIFMFTDEELKQFRIEDEEIKRLKQQKSKVQEIV